MQVVVGQAPVTVPEAALPPTAAVALDVLYGGAGAGLRMDAESYHRALTAVGAVKIAEHLEEAWIPPPDFTVRVGMDWTTWVGRQAHDRMRRAIALRLAWQRAARGGRGGWLAGFRHLWDRIVPYRSFPHGHAGRALKPAVQALGVDVVERAWRSYLLSAEPMTANPSWFIDRLPALLPAQAGTNWSETVARVGCPICTFGHLDRDVTALWDCPGPEVVYRTGPTLCRWGSGLWALSQALARRRVVVQWPARFWNDLSVWCWTHHNGAFGSCRQNLDCHAQVAAAVGMRRWEDVGFFDEYESRSGGSAPWHEHYDRLKRRQFLANLGAVDWPAHDGDRADCHAL